MGRYDDIVKLITRNNPQSIVSFLLDGALYESDVDRELQATTVRADSLYHVTWNDEKIILHVEFQRSHDNEMPRRVWKYNALADVSYDKPVYSVVIYLIEEGSITEPYYERCFKNGHVTHRYEFAQICLWEIPPDVLEQPGREGLLPLLPLTREGQNYATVDRMIDRLTQAYKVDRLTEESKDDLLALGRAVASLVLTTPMDHLWIHERFQEMMEILKQSWVVQETLEEGKEIGRQEGEIKGERNTALRFIQRCYPGAYELACEVFAREATKEQMQTTLDRLFDADNLAKVMVALHEHAQ